MSKPRTDYEDPIAGALSELDSAAAALHMRPQPLEPHPGLDSLIDTDYWAAHAGEHLKAARQLLAGARDARN